VERLSEGIEEEEERKIWNAFPFTKLYIRVGQWTIE
jgi:hypothetical protein